MVSLPTFEVNVVQYFRPYGRSELMHIQLDMDYLEKYNLLAKHNCRLEAEVLRTDEVSITITSEEEDIHIKVVPNGPQVLESIYQLLDEFYEKNNSTTDSKDSSSILPGTSSKSN